MANEFFTHLLNRITPGSRARADQVNSIADEIEVGLDKLPTELELKQSKATYGTDAGAANAYVVTLPHAPVAYADGMEVQFKAATANTGASTINVNGLGAVALNYANDTALDSGALATGQIVQVRYNSTTSTFNMMSQSPVQVTAAQTARTAAEVAQAAAEAALDSFDDRYLGSKASDPTLDNDGDALIDGALYFNESTPALKVYHLGTATWQVYNPNYNTLKEISQFYPNLDPVDVSIYDTSKDTDGGAWRMRAAENASYAGEDVPSGRYLGQRANATAAIAAGGVDDDWFYHTGSNDWVRLSGGSGVGIYRAGSKYFPASVAIVAEADRVIIFDITKDIPEMWMVFTADTNSYIAYNTISSVHMLNGNLLVGQSGAGALSWVDFISDQSIGSIILHVTGFRVLLPISGRNNADIDNRTQDVDDIIIIDRGINHVAITVLPDAPIDLTRGIAVPTIAVATDGGVSVIKDDGNVWDCVHPSAGFRKAHKITFYDDTTIRYLRSIDSGTEGEYLQDIEIPTADSHILLKQYSDGTIPALLGGWNDLLCIIEDIIGSTDGVSLLDVNPDSPDDGLVSHITHEYNTGWQHGDSKLATLCETDTTDLVDTNTIPDRSVNSNDLIVHGNITVNPVATNAELASYSGFNATNYLEQPYSSSLDFGTGDFCVMGWVDVADLSTQIILSKSPSSSIVTPYFELKAHNPNGITWMGNAGSSKLVDATDYSSHNSIHVCFTRLSGNGYLYVNGELKDSSVNTDNYDHSNADTLRFGNRQDGYSGNFISALSKWCISASAPSAEQIKHIYETERKLFEEDAKCTLDGSSDSVTDVAYDESTNTYHVATDFGVSEFSGLERVSSTATTIGTPQCLSASNGKLLTGGSAGALIEVPQKSIRELFEEVRQLTLTDAQIKHAYENNDDTNVFLDSEKTKLGTVDTDAADDQTGAEIKAAYESESNTNAYTDSEKTKNSFRGALVARTVALTIADDSSVAFEFDTENYDTDSIHSVTGNRERLTVPEGVTKVRLTATIDYAVHATGFREIEIYKNGSGAVGCGRVSVAAAPIPSTTCLNIQSAPLTVVADDYFEVRCHQDSGTTLGVNEPKCWFAMDIIE